MKCLTVEQLVGQAVFEFLTEGWASEKDRERDPELSQGTFPHGLFAQVG